MNEDNLSRGYICLYRSLLDNPVFTQHPEAYLKVFLYCLLKATYKPKTFQGIDLPIGSFVGSSIEMAAQCRLTRPTIRGALEALAKSHMISMKSTNKYTLYIVENFEAYQNGNLQISQQTASNSPAKNQQLASRPATDQPQTINKKQETRTLSPPPAAVEAEFELSSDSEPGKESRKRLDALFNEFWKIVWLHDGKEDSKKAWARMVKDEATALERIRQAKVQGPRIKEIAAEIAASRGTKPRPLHVATWLNGNRWRDESLNVPAAAEIDTISPEQLSEKKRKALESLNADRAERGLPPVDDFE